jgi:hypothetical protein
VALDEADSAVADGDGSTFLDEFGGVALEKGIGSSGFVGDDSSGEGGLAVVGLGLFFADYLNVDIVSIAGIRELAHLDEARFSKT